MQYVRAHRFPACVVWVRWKTGHRLHHNINSVRLHAVTFLEEGSDGMSVQGWGLFTLGLGGYPAIEYFATLLHFLVQTLCCSRGCLSQTAIRRASVTHTGQAPCETSGRPQRRTLLLLRALRDAATTCVRCCCKCSLVMVLSGQVAMC